MNPGTGNCPRYKNETNVRGTTLFLHQAKFPSAGKNAETCLLALPNSTSFAASEFR